MDLYFLPKYPPYQRKRTKKERQRSRKSSPKNKYQQQEVRWVLWPERPFTQYYKVTIVSRYWIETNQGIFKVWEYLKLCLSALKWKARIPCFCLTGRWILSTAPTSALHSSTATEMALGWRPELHRWMWAGSFLIYSDWD